ncbi:hypothetical protein [Parasphingorhabdus sp. NYA22]
MFWRMLATIICFSTFNGLAWGKTENQVRSVDIYITPFYTAADTEKKRTVRVDSRFDKLLRSDDHARIVEVQSAIRLEPENVSPLTMMVLASRLYDVGERDASVFWFYAAKDRFFTMADVLEGYSRPAPLTPKGETYAAIVSFVRLAGPAINGYAFCDIEKQQMLRKEAFKWVQENPYALLFDEKQQAKEGGRQALLEASLLSNGMKMNDESAYLQDSENVAALKDGRRQNGADSRYCW